MLRERLGRYSVSLLNYCITSNHVHLLLRVPEGTKAGVSRFMQSLEGDFAQYYNIRKKRKGAFWEDRYHAVMIDTGEYLWRCLRYIDLNMVRAGEVKHPVEWDWCGYRELLGHKKRNRVSRATLDVEKPGGTKRFLDTFFGARQISRFVAS